MRKIIPLSLCLLMVTLFSGCFVTDMLAQKASQVVTEKVLESTTNTNVDIDSGTVTVTSEDGTTTSISTSESTAVDLPANFPSDIPVYTGAMVTAVSTSGTNGFYVTAVSQMDYTAISDFYNAELVTQGWTIDNTSTTNTGDKSTFIFASKAERSLMVGLYQTAGSEDVSISLSQSVIE